MSRRDLLHSFPSGIIDPKTVDNSKLEESIKTRDYDGVKIALQGNIDINAPNSSGLTPLTLALQYRPLFSIVELLIRAGADIQLGPPDGGPLLLLLEKYHDLHLDRIRHINYDDERNVSEIIKLLLKEGVDPNLRSSETPLILAIDSELPCSVIENLIEFGARVNDNNSRRQTPLATVVNVHLNRIEYSDSTFFANGGKINYVFCLIKALLKAGANVSSLTDTEKYLLLYYLILKEPERNNDGNTPTSENSIAKMVVGSFEPRIVHQGNYLFELAIFNKKWEIANILFKLGYREGRMQYNGDTLLMRLVVNGNIEMLENFLDLVHPNPLAVDQESNNVFNIINKILNRAARFSWYPKETIKDLRDKKEILEKYLYSWLRNIGGYLQPGVIPTDLIKVIGDEISNQ